ncbi:ATP-binding protein [Streptomyces sp. NPDC049040]|uniref:ATP-binding protein n=1 Tax=Streptomyces sp. NPDC049040 TaxID=3365593 RepID=UPI0037129ADA
MALPRNDTATSGAGSSAGTAAVEASTVPAQRGAAGYGFELPSRGEVVGEARRRVCGYLRDSGCDDDTCATAALLISELATNVVRHTASPAFRCRVAYDGDRVSLEVEDSGGTSALPRRREAGPGDVDGRGLMLVEALCEEWCTTPGRYGGRIVRAVLRASRD